MVGYNIKIQLINYVDALAVWGLRPHAPPLTMSVDLTGIKLLQAFAIDHCQVFSPVVKSSH